MQWVRERSKPYRLEFHYNLDDAIWKDVQNTLIESKKWCKQNSMMILDDGLFYIRFTNERDLAWFLLRWA